MNGRAILLVVVAFALGALAAGSIGVRVIREVNTTEDATSLPAVPTTVPPPIEAPTYQVDPDETLVSSTALVPISVEGGGTDLSLEYELVSLAPHAGVSPIRFFGNFGSITVIDNADLDHIYPKTWVVETANDSFEGGPANFTTRIARFEVDEGFSPSEIEAVRITEAYAPFPIDVTFTLSQSEPSVEVFPGVTVDLLNISDQGTSWIVQIEIGIDDQDLAGFFVTGEGPGWRSAVFEAEGRPRVNLTWVDGPLPDPIPLRATGTVWMPLSGDFDVSLDGLQ